MHFIGRRQTDRRQGASSRRTSTTRVSARRARASVVLAGAACALALGVGAVHAAAPPNDAIATAEVIEGESGTRTGTNVEATLEAGEPTHEGEHSVWYRWTSPVTSQFVFQTCNTGAAATTFDTILAIYTGPSVSEWRRLAANDDACSEQSRVTITAEAGTTYHVVVAGYDDDESGRFALTWRRLVAPANDAFAAPQQLTGATGSVVGTNLAATVEVGEPAHGVQSVASVWYTWTSPATAPVTFETCGSTFDTLLAVYTGDAVAALARVGQNDDGCGEGSRVPLAARAGTTYRIAVAGYDDRGDFVLRWLPRPANDDVANARTIRGGAGSLSGSSVGATREAGEPGPQSASVWYQWRAPSSKPIAFETCTSSFDTLLAVYQRTSAGRRVVRSNDDGCPRGFGSLVVLHPQRGTTYQVSVDGLSGTTGSFRLAWGRPPRFAWCIVPDVRGRTVLQARTVLENANCALGRIVRIASTIAPRGRIVAQFPLPSSTRRSYGTRVNVEVSTGRR